MDFAPYLNKPLLNGFYRQLSESTGKIIAYLRVSTDKQDFKNQKLEILDYAHQSNIEVNKFLEITCSARNSHKNRLLDELMNTLCSGDTLIVSELSRLARSLGQIIQIVDELVKNNVKLFCIKENISINPKSRDLQSKVTITMFGLFAEIERDLISERTKAGLQSAREKGKVLGRPKGSLGNSKLDGKEKEIKNFLNKGVSKTAIAKIFDVSRTCLYSFIETRKIS